MNDNNSSTMYPTMEPTMYPTMEPAMNPTTGPTMEPVIEPVISPYSEVDLYGLPSSKLMNALGEGPTMNVKSNIIAGPNMLSYYNHSPGAERPEVREEGPFPIQGSIGSLLANEAVDYLLCSPKVDDYTIPNIGASPNCAGTFKPDAYTKENTCGAECQMKYPESYGEKDFGFPEEFHWTQKVSDSHQVHSYANIRAGMPGQGPSNDLGCYEWVPRVTSDKSTNSCVLNPEPVYETVPSWYKLKEYSQIFQKVKYLN